ncbi:MAG: hypothetical protein U0936_11225 [Planctomycetaceae bacterium]
MLPSFGRTILRTSGLGLLGNSYGIVKTGLVDGGVSFTATAIATITTSGDSIIGYQEQSGLSGGLGVVGTIPGGNTLNGTNGEESLRFVMQLSNYVGGSAVFNGFSTVGFSNFGSSDRGVLSKDTDFFSGADNDVITSGGTLNAFDPPVIPQAFSMFSDLGQFQVAFVTGSFTGTAAVPEPGGAIFLTLMATAIPVVRRFRRRPNTVDSDSLVA